MPCDHPGKFQYVIVFTLTETIRWCRQCGAIKGWRPADQAKASLDEWQPADGQELPMSVWNQTVRK